MFKFIHKYFPSGIFPYIARFFGLLEEKLSATYRLKQFVRKKGYRDPKDKDKAPRWASELLQIIFILIGIISIFFIDPIKSSWWLKYPILIILFYRLIEIFIFLLSWIFAHEGQVHNHRRSVWGFLLNIVELSLYTSSISYLVNCLKTSISAWELVYKHFVNIFTFSPIDLKASPCCNILSYSELIISVLLVLVVLAGLVGAIIRDEVGN